jgi:GNAT superfamily N-acetyltransferase
MRCTFADDEAQQRACFLVMQELRQHLDEDTFMAQVARQAAQGYRLAYLEADGDVCAVAGFRLGETLAWGKFLYVDDLVTASHHRSKGYGKALLDFLINHAQENDCAMFHLDSGVQRHEAHAFYFREGLRITSYHFVKLTSRAAHDAPTKAAEGFCG